ncbi:MAG: indole-3-glycerol phosphate synthase TrpC [Candidatus Omnitrophota bacterium]
MKNFLKEIVEHKKELVRRHKEEVPVEDLCSLMGDVYAPSRFAGTIAQGGIHLIAELKKASPSAGLLRADYEVTPIAQAYEKAGASCLSVLTEDKFFQGTLADLDEVKQASLLPVLRKDFIIDEYQLYQSKAHGADAVLLIASILEPCELKHFLKVCHKLKLDVVTEVHTTPQLKEALEAGASVIGINARSLTDFYVDLKILPSLIKEIPKDKLIICESGVKTLEDLQLIKDLRPNAVLVGEGLIKGADVFSVTKSFVDSLKAL